MGKKSSFKQLRKLAAELPEILVYTRVGSLVSKEVLEAKGLEVPLPETREQRIKAAEGGDIYHLKENKLVPLNHYQKLKDALQKHGSEGVMAYVRQVRKFDEQRKMKAMVAGQAELDLGEQQFVTEAQSELDAIDATTDQIRPVTAAWSEGFSLRDTSTRSVDQSAPTFDEGEE